MSEDKRNLPTVNGEVLPPIRNVGIRVGDRVYMPALPVDENHARALQGCIDAHTGALIALDRFYATAAAFATPRAIAWQPAAELAAQAEQERELLHQRTLAEIRREQEVVEAETKVLQAKHRHEAAVIFKEDKFELGRMRFAEKTAKHGVGEAVARASIQEDTDPNPPEHQPATATIHELIIQHLELVEQNIDEAEGSGGDTEKLRAERDALSMMLRREIKKAKA